MDTKPGLQGLTKGQQDYAHPNLWKENVAEGIHISLPYDYGREGMPPSTLQPKFPGPTRTQPAGLNWKVEMWEKIILKVCVENIITFKRTKWTIMQSKDTVGK